MVNSCLLLLHYIYPWLSVEQCLVFQLPLCHFHLSAMEKRVFAVTAGKGTSFFYFMNHEERSDKGHLQLMRNELAKMSWGSKCQEELMC